MKKVDIKIMSKENATAMSKENATAMKIIMNRDLVVAMAKANANEERIDVLYNACRGCFGISDEAKDLYEKKTGTQIKHPIVRHDPILIEIYKEIGSKRCSDQWSELDIRSVLKRYKNYYYIHEPHNNGYEDISINFDKFLSDHYTLLQDIMEDITYIVHHSDMSADEKINELKNCITTATALH